MKMMNHQRHGLALFLDAVPGHQFSQRLPGAGHGMHSQLFLAASLSPRRSLCRSFFLRGCHGIPLQCRWPAMPAKLVVCVVARVPSCASG
jgi:hypothetical protein